MHVMKFLFSHAGSCCFLHGPFWGIVWLSGTEWVGPPAQLGDAQHPLEKPQHRIENRRSPISPSSSSSPPSSAWLGQPLELGPIPTPLHPLSTRRGCLLAGEATTTRLKVLKGSSPPYRAACVVSPLARKKPDSILSQPASQPAGGAGTVRSAGRHPLGNKPSNPPPLPNPARALSGCG